MLSALATQDGEAAHRDQPGGAPGHQGLWCSTCRRQGYRVTESRWTATGCLDMDLYEKSLTPDTAIVSLMWANNETGVLFPVEKAAEMARERGILFHTDAVQAVGKIPIDMKQKHASTCSPSPATSCTRPKGSGRSMCARGPGFPLS